MSEEGYQLTPFGFMAGKLGVDAKHIMEELFDYMKDADFNAIVFEDYVGSFEKVEFVKEWDEEEN